MDFDDYYSQNLPQVSPIVPTTQVRDLTATQTQRLLDRLLQELDDENADLDILNKLLNELSLKSNIDYKLWSKRDMSVSLDTGSITRQSGKGPPDSHLQIANDDLLRQLNDDKKENDNQFDTEDHNAQRACLLSLLHREKKLSRHYESLISAYENLIAYTAMSVRERREQNYGVYNSVSTQVQSLGDKGLTNDDNSIKNRKTLRSIQSIQISQSLISRAQALKKNADLLRILAQQKRQDMEMVKNLIASEAEELAIELDKEDEVHDD